jgi:hypothetical protein
MNRITDFFTNLWDYVQENPMLAISAVLGLVVFIILIYLFIRLRRKEQAVNEKEQRGTGPAEISEVALSPYTVADIRKAMTEGVSEDRISKLFKGARVRWIGDLLRARPQGEDLIRVAIEFTEVGMFPVAFCTVPLSRYPELKVLYQGARVAVQGTISGISNTHVSLDDAVLSLSV